MKAAPGPRLELLLPLPRRGAAADPFCLIHAHLPCAALLPATPFLITAPAGIGFSTAEVKLDRLPGWEPHSYGYHGDDGHAFSGRSTGRAYGPIYTTGGWGRHNRHSRTGRTGWLACCSCCKGGPFAGGSPAACRPCQGSAVVLPPPAATCLPSAHSINLPAHPFVSWCVCTALC